MDAESFKILVNECHAAMRSRALAITGDEQETDELVQDVCVKLWENPAGLDRADNRRAYCIRAVHNAALSAVRRRRRYDSLESASQVPVTEPTDEEDYLRTLIRQLPQKQRVAFCLRQAGLEFDNIAQRMGLQPDNVRQLICRARKRLRELYEQEY